MKKIFFMLPIILLVAAGCNTNQQQTNNQAPTPPTQQTSTGLTRIPREKINTTSQGIFDGSSMKPALESGQVFNMDKTVTNYQRADIVFFNSKGLSSNEQFIKRIVGLPGEQVEIKNGSVFVNQQKLDESVYLSSDIQTMGKAGVVTLGADEYFVLGDNRPASVDSRFFGPIKKSWIFAKVTPTNYSSDIMHP